MNELQKVELDLFIHFKEICKQLNLTYFMVSGSALGAVRHGGFIPWDDDLDICMIREDYEKFLDIAKEELPKDLFLQTRETDPYYDYLALPCKIRDTKSLIIENGTEKKNIIWDYSLIYSLQIDII
jgi:lipopolysaccharide cholinephosphotransferase